MKPTFTIVRNCFVAALLILTWSACRNGSDTSGKALPIVSKESPEVAADSVASPTEPPTEPPARPAVKPTIVAPPTGDYYFISLKAKDTVVRDAANAFIKGLRPAERRIVFRLNRVDPASYRRLDTMVVPAQIDTVWMNYAVFPAQLPILNEVRKMVIFSYYAQAFAAYESGKLVYWGPSNMGKKKTPTPTGLFSTNWKARETISTVDDEWILKWNFNIWNKGGVGWHQYAMPGIPASHSCMRLLESDAMWLYNWAEMWILKDNQLAAQGTPVLIFGAYPFGKPKPWWSLVADPHAMDISEDSMTALLTPLMPKIMARQSTRDSVIAARQQSSPSSGDVSAQDATAR